MLDTTPSSTPRRPRTAGEAGPWPRSASAALVRSLLVFTPLVLTLLAVTGCSLLVSFKDECKADGDCASRGVAFRCVSGLCVTPPAPSGDAGLTATSGCSGDDAGACFACTPTNNSEVINACSSTQCTPFNNAARLTRLYSDGGLPPVPDVEAAARGGGTR